MTPFRRNLLQIFMLFATWANSSPVFAADWIWRITDQTQLSKQTQSIVTVFADGRMEEVTFNSQGRAVSRQITQVPAPELQLIQQIAADTRQAEWKTRELCPGQQCAQDSVTTMAVKGADGRVRTMIRIDWGKTELRFRDTATVRELIRLMDEAANVHP